MANHPTTDGHGGAEEPHVKVGEGPDAAEANQPETFTATASYLEVVSLISTHLGPFQRCRHNKKRVLTASWGRSDEDDSRPMARVFFDPDFTRVEIESRETAAFYALYGRVVLHGFLCDLVGADDFGDDSEGEE